MSNEKEIVLSAIQPTGDLHLGNYLGAIKNWVSLQEDYQCFYGVVDYHSITMPYNPKKLRENTWNMAFQLMACGVKAENLFIQSMVPEHAELCWILGCIVSFGDLERMTQFKDKKGMISSKDTDTIVSGGLFYYPVLQAADILIYHADYVPVGQDQTQHLELSRRIADRFNNQFKKEYFKLPEPKLTKLTKVLSLADPSRKMSKSLGEKHCINLFGNPDRIRKQVISAVTDSLNPNSKLLAINTKKNPPTEEINEKDWHKYNKKSAGLQNLFNIYREVGDKNKFTEFNKLYEKGSLKYEDFKNAIADSLIDLSSDLKERYNMLNLDKKYVRYQIKESSENIRSRAQKTLREVKEIVGLLSPGKNEKNNLML